MLCFISLGGWMQLTACTSKPGNLGPNLSPLCPGPPTLLTPAMSSFHAWIPPWSPVASSPAPVPHRQLEPWCLDTSLTMALPCLMSLGAPDRTQGEIQDTGHGLKYLSRCGLTKLSSLILQLLAHLGSGLL